MKHIRVALVLCALPATALAQGVVCQTCDHVAPYFRGEGGFIATVAEGADEVVFVASCGNVTTTGEVEAGGGTVAQLFTWRNGLACDQDDGSLDIAGVEDGGWYWITMGTNSAVGGLVSMDILENDMVDITDAGEGVKMMAGKGAVLLSETATGRVGILPTILPEPPMDPASVCGPRQSDDWPYAYDSQATSSCMLGGGRTKIRLVGPGSFGSTAQIMNGMVYRPNSGTVTVTADLWVDGMGSYSTATDDGENPAGPTAASMQKGWPGTTATALGAGSGENWLHATFGANVAAAVGAPVAVAAPTTQGEAGVPTAGVSQVHNGSASTTSGRDGGDAPIGQAVFQIGPDSAYCSRTNNHAAVVTIYAVPIADDGTEPDNNLHPPIAVGRAAGLGNSSAVRTLAAVTQLRVVCPPR